MRKTACLEKYFFIIAVFEYKLENLREWNQLALIKKAPFWLSEEIIDHNQLFSVKVNYS